MKFLFARVMLALLLIPACISQGGEKEEVHSIVGEEDGGDFRGTMMGDDVNTVLAKESDNVVYNMPDEITCRIPLDMKDSTFYEVSYNFDRGLLNAIKLDLYPASEQGAIRLKDEFSKYYEKRYGNGELRDNVKYWTTRGSRGRDVEISMTLSESDINYRLRINFIEAQ